MSDAVIERPYLLFLGEAPSNLWAKTAAGIAHWRPEWCAGQISLPGCGADCGLDELTLEAAIARGAKTLVLGVAPGGGAFPDAWSAIVVAAMEAGLDIAAGLHSRLAEIPALAEAAKRHGCQLIDVRHPTQDFNIATPDKRSGHRLLTVGTDCCVGKMYAALALEREMKARGMKADFRATGQTGIFIAERGVSVDAVVSDFISGATQWLTPGNDGDHWDLIEGQGSLFHVSFSGVSLGLLHGSQPEALVLCHDASRTHNDDFPDVELPSLSDCAEANLSLARLSNPAARLVGVALNTSKTDPAGVERLLAETAEKLGVPCVDPVATGVAAIVDNL
ncbi:MAG: N-acetyltransferase DgcN [Alphaproteobacteria bacterium]